MPGWSIMACTTGGCTVTAWIPAAMSSCTYSTFLNDAAITLVSMPCAASMCGYGDNTAHAVAAHAVHVRRQVVGPAERGKEGLVGGVDGRGQHASPSALAALMTRRSVRVTGISPCGGRPS